MPSNNRNQEFRRELDIRKLMKRAQETAGLSDFGDEGFIGPLGRFLDCVASDVNFHPAGLEEFKNETTRSLMNRLRFQNDLKLHPDILDEDVSDPIMIIGLPRSGTTKTQRMMGADPTLLKVHTWELLNPAPFSSTVPGQQDPRIAAAAGTDFTAGGKQGEVHAAHYMAVELVEEDWALFDFTFNDWCLFMRNPSRSWHEWMMSRTNPPDLGNYRYVYKLFQYLQWQQGGRRNRRWLMKSCGHLGHLEELITTFPKATIVHVHRHPLASVPSFAKILLDVGNLRVADLDPKFIGELVFDWAQTCVRKYLTVRDRLGLDDRIIDVQYDQIRSDPIPVFEEIYRRAGHALSDEAKLAMTKWESDNEQGKHGKHVYSLEQFGLSERGIDDAFGDYIRRFIRRG